MIIKAMIVALTLALSSGVALAANAVNTAVVADNTATLSIPKMT